MTEKRAEVVLEWAEHYLRHRDLILRTINSLESKDNRIIVKYKDGSSEQLIAFPDLEKLTLNNIKENITIVTFNTKENFKVLIDKWKSFAEIKELKLIFFNSESETEKRWIIKPYIHNRICDEKSLKQGLSAMFETVETLA